MNNKLYVGNLPFTISEDRLRELFSQFGTVVSVKIMQEDGRSKGFGFVEMQSEDEAQDAAKGLNGTDLEGRSIKVEISRPKESRGRDDFRGGDRRGGPRGGGFRDR